MKQILRDSRTVESRWGIRTDERIARKKQRLIVLSVILDMHMTLRRDEPDCAYLKGLRHRIGRTKAELKAMGIDLHR